MSVNKCILVGNVGKDPEVRQFENNSVASFSLATTEKGYTTKEGKVIADKTEWHNIVAWKGLATLAEKYITKGSQIYVEGKITTRMWEKDGAKHYQTEIIADVIQLLGTKKEEPKAEPDKYASTPRQPKQADAFDMPPKTDSDDLPF
jgi:single-strand DNA-binding protein